MQKLYNWLKYMVICIVATQSIFKNLSLVRGLLQCWFSWRGGFAFFSLKASHENDPAASQGSIREDIKPPIVQSSWWANDEVAEENKDFMFLNRRGVIYHGHLNVWMTVLKNPTPVQPGCIIHQGIYIYQQFIPGYVEAEFIN